MLTKIKPIVFAAALSALMLLGCDLGAQQKKSYDLKGFTTVSLSLAADLYVSQEAEYKVEIVAPESIIEKLDVYVDGQTLKIKTTGFKAINWRDDDVKIYVSLPIVKGLHLSGSGDIIAQTAIKTDDLKVSISGSGDVSIKSLTAQTLKLAISGSGDMELAGPAIVSSVDVAVSGSGDIDLSRLQASDVDVAISGSGDIKIWANENLRGKVSGSGDIYYKGRPRFDVKVSGSGRVTSL
ncbi:MAG: DUF2807 domain-containing protein [Bacteroidales bacterium]|nr:DUF2807 domain-containing protein [Bacteroidales bacterium]MBN2749514.1 DUF2807 domain-containing protein [Bacteroidales bacterium]